MDLYYFLGEYDITSLFISKRTSFLYCNSPYIKYKSFMSKLFKPIDKYKKNRWSSLIKYDVDKWKSNFEDNTIGMCCTEEQSMTKIIPKEIIYYYEYAKIYVSYYVKGIYLNNIGLKKLDNEIFNKRYLKALCVNHSKIKKINKKIDNLELEYIYINNGLIKNINNSLFNLKCLHTLDLSNNKMKVIPKEIGNLISLKNLSFGSNMIEAIPKELFLLINLEKLILCRNKIKEIPKEIIFLIHIIDLILSENKIEIIPDEIINLKTLKIFFATYNPIKNSEIKEKLNFIGYLKMLGHEKYYPGFRFN